MNSEISHRASLVFNVVLTVTVVVLALPKLGRESAPSAVAVGPGKMTEGTPVFGKQPKLPRYADLKSAADQRRSIVDQLRAMGVPNDVLALVARVDFEVQWDSRFEACQGDGNKLAAVQLEMEKSKDAAMRAALGEEGFKQWDQKTMLWEAMSTKVEVSASEAGAIYDLKKTLQQRQRDLEQARLQGTMDDAQINQASDKAYSEYNQQLKALLGGDRYAKSQQLDDAFVADNLRHELAKANPNDAQFQELFKLEQENKKVRLELDSSSATYAEQIKALDEARDQAYQRVLGTDAFNTLKKEQDPGYSTMKKYETLWGLDDSKIDYVYGTMQQYQKGVEDYKAQVLALQAQGQNVDWAAVDQHLQQLANQTQQTLQNYVGPDSFDKLQRNHVYKFALVRPRQ